MVLKKYGTEEKIRICKQSSFEFDPNIIVKKIVQTVGNGTMTLDQVHEAVKALGIVDYKEEDMKELLTLLESSGVTIQRQ